MEVLRYADEVTKAQTYFRGLPADTADEDMLDLATSIIDKRTAPFKPEEFRDRYVDALHRLIDKKARSKSNTRILEDVDEPIPGKGNVIDLMAALRKSVGAKADVTPPRSRRAAAKEKPPAPGTGRRKRA